MKYSTLLLLNLLSWLACLTVIAFSGAGLLTCLLAGVPITFGLLVGVDLMQGVQCGE